MMFAIVLLLVAGVGTSLAPWYELFLPLRFATALAIGGLMISSFVLSECYNKLIKFFKHIACSAKWPGHLKPHFLL
jgi:hypothetical protein